MLTPTEKKLCWGRSGSPLMDKCWYFSLLNFLDSYWVWLQSNSGNGRIYYLKNVCELPILRSASCLLKFKQREKKINDPWRQKETIVSRKPLGATLLATDKIAPGKINQLVVRTCIPLRLDAILAFAKVDDTSPGLLECSVQWSVRRWWVGNSTVSSPWSAASLASGYGHGNVQRVYNQLQMMYALNYLLIIELIDKRKLTWFVVDSG